MTFLSPARLLRAACCAALAVLSVSGLSAQTVDAQAVVSTSQPIPGRYIIVFKDNATDSDADDASDVRSSEGRRHHRYFRVLKGFSATLSAAAVERIRRHPAVDYVEQDQTVSTSLVQGSATWGLDRIDQVDRPLDIQYAYNYTGAGVYAFIIDTGIRSDHSEFAGRVLPGFTSIVDANGTNDCNGHGTHVAGTVGGMTWGVAKDVSLIPVRVLDCAGSGTNSGVIAGIDWVARSALRPAVANMSLGGSKSTAINDAVKNAVAQGVVMAVAAGNSNVDACNSSPASEPSAITVGATTTTDARASFSNFGKCVDIFAPGLNITSSWNQDGTPTKLLSGTSMATPHVTGAAALALQANPAATPLAVTNFLLAHASVNKVSSAGTGSPNLLLYSLGAGAPVEPPPVSMAVKSLFGKSARSGRNWIAQVTIAVRNVSNGANIANATVTGTFAPGGAGSCVTNTTGTCTINSAVIVSTTTMSVFRVDNVAATGKTYASGQNSATQVNVIKR